MSDERIRFRDSTFRVSRRREKAGSPRNTANLYNVSAYFACSPILKVLSANFPLYLANISRFKGHAASRERTTWRRGLCATSRYTRRNTKVARKVTKIYTDAKVTTQNYFSEWDYIVDIKG